MAIKITSWKIEHAERLLSDAPTPAIMERCERIRNTLLEIGADILCLQEGPPGEKGIEDFSTLVLNREWLPVMVPFDESLAISRDAAYATKGKQWIWFLVRPQLADRCRLQAPKIWQAFTVGAFWPVHLWG
jgi:hypothetical protein